MLKRLPTISILASLLFGGSAAFAVTTFYTGTASAQVIDLDEDEDEGGGAAKAKP
jgi:hypothetical protein